MHEMCQGCPCLRYLVDKSVEPPGSLTYPTAGHSSDSDVHSRERQYVTLRHAIYSTELHDN